MNLQELDFFLGAVSPIGFAGYFQQTAKNACDDTSVLLKSGPGCGKSTLLRRLAEHLKAQGETVELIHCSADPDSLDGIICRARKFSAVDATPPHSLEPSYPIAFEDIVSLYRAVDKEKLQQNRGEIVRLFRLQKSLSERVIRYIAAAGSLLQDSRRIALSCTDTEKVRHFAGVLARRYIPFAEGTPHEEIRILSAVTLNGLVFYSDTIEKLADTVIILDDEYGAAGRVLLYTLREEALRRNHSVITCYCSMNPHEKIDHLFIPALRLGFVTSNSYHPVASGKGRRVIHSTRFASKDGLKIRSKRLKFNKKAVNELFGQACGLQREVKQCHDELEKYYMDAADFSFLDKAYQYLLTTL